MFVVIGAFGETGKMCLISVLIERTGEADTAYRSAPLLKTDTYISGFQSTNRKSPCFKIPTSAWGYRNRRWSG
jgi:hypothetical protein